MGSKSHTTKLVLGAILGGAIVGTSAAFLTSKSGRKLKNNAANTIEDLKDKLDDFLVNVSKKTKNIASDVSDRADDYSDKIQDFAAQITEQVECLGTTENKEKLTAFLIGGILGGMLGAGAATWISEPSKKNDIIKSLGSSAYALKDTIKDILEVLEDNTESTAKSISKNSKTSVKDVIDFASTGIQLWQKFQSKK